ncbi:MAG: bifunctional proline dehydrogenase/L-glutamate gamma-semialdehyde dehydrogenase PutA [Burkholderiales bacterium]|nr:bifunctional proline dehydrogenase/L-glutamate gamma-semialdehyde dehydrogenase PutA [Burkholderiales bacterium]
MVDFFTMSFPIGNIRSLHRAPEADTVAALLPEARLAPAQIVAAQSLATRLAEGVRAARLRAGGVDALMLEFSLDSREGIALMCLAEALLRIPDPATRDRLLRDKLAQGDWRAHVGRSPSLFVNAAAWGLVVTGKLVDSRHEGALEAALASLLRKGGEPLVRKGVDLAMRMLGRQFVLGRSIDEALDNARERRARGYRFSFDMLGEAALTADDAQRYFAAYEAAIHAIGAQARHGRIDTEDGISIKLSALHPRYVRSQRDRVRAELHPRVVHLARLARDYGIGMNIDAEEADRLELSLDLLAALAAEPTLADWPGMGFVVQAYQKRARAVIDGLVALAHRHARRFMVRLVKGAYWDSEIKRAQVDGLVDYPVFTRKVHTDVSYLACARAMLAAPEAIYPQFATHNAFTIAALHTLAGDADYEFQCLHGMGESTYDLVVARDGLARPCRIYAPVGSHETLLAYLVRRLLENGANSSFVNRIVDPTVPIAELVADPVAQTEATGGRPHPRIALPSTLYPDRRNSRGLDLADENVLAEVEAQLAAAPAPPHVAPILVADAPRRRAERAVRNPADHRDIVGFVADADASDVATAIASALADTAWMRADVEARARVLERAADLIEEDAPTLRGLAVREAGKSVANAHGEVREAADFCRYYAAQARLVLRGTTPRGPLACIAPWNFPLSIFVGQVSAALAAGNPVLAKPAEQTPLVAARAVELLHRAGVPRSALQCLPGRGEDVGAALVADARIAGVLFTGSTAVAHAIARELASRTDDPVLVAETGGLNAMIVDSSALAEQAVTDALVSAFDSAGQRCSALRLLCLQDDIADGMLSMLHGALHELRVGDPRDLATDVGPVIDEEARSRLAAHVAHWRARARTSSAALPPQCRHGTFVAPTIIEIASPRELTREVFGPILHVTRYREGELGELVAAINAAGYGLTHGIHTRIDETMEFIATRIRAGNVYVNRNIIGAVVGVQPFGGEGLSGTGPKAGGPLYLRRLVRERLAPPPSPLVLAGPTGETNTWSQRPRATVACLGEGDDALREQVALVLGLGGVARVPATTTGRALQREHGVTVSVADDPLAAADAVLIAAPQARVAALRVQLADATGPRVPVLARSADATRPPAAGAAPACPYDLLRLATERTLTVNTTASGGNASLLALAPDGSE